MIYCLHSCLLSANIAVWSGHQFSFFPELRKEVLAEVWLEELEFYICSRFIMEVFIRYFKMTEWARKDTDCSMMKTKRLSLCLNLVVIRSSIWCSSFMVYSWSLLIVINTRALERMNMYSRDFILISKEVEIFKLLAWSINWDFIRICLSLLLSLDIT